MIDKHVREQKECAISGNRTRVSRVKAGGNSTTGPRLLAAWPPAMLGQVYIYKFCFWLFIIRHERRIFPTMPNYNLPETIFLVHLRREKKGRGNQPEEITCKEYQLKAKQNRTGGIAVKERFTFFYPVLISCFDKRREGEIIYRSGKGWPYN